MEKSQVVIFNKTDIRGLLETFDFKIGHRKISETRKKEVVLSHEGNPLQCPSCNKEIRVGNVGTISHGSRLVFCDNPLCFASWVAENKIQ